MIDMYQLLRYSLIIAVLLQTSCDDRKESIRINEFQIIGSHNSYKLAVEDPLLEVLKMEDERRALSLEYEHPSLSEQLDLGLRNLELDVLYDPQGGRYSNPLGLRLIEQSGLASLPFDHEEKLGRPGLKLFHIPDIDFRSHHLLFKEALEELNVWSLRNPDHFPVIITMNAKDSGVGKVGYTAPLPFDQRALDSIDSEIAEVFSKDQLITPDLIRGDYPTLESAVRTEGWPNLKSVRGRFLFVLDETGEKRAYYIEGHPSLAGRLMFVTAEVDTPEAAFLILNDPIKQFDVIRQRVEQGYFVRTRADADTWEARENDYLRFEQAEQSGAQIITTDYYIPSGLFESDYIVRFQDGSYLRKKSTESQASARSSFSPK